jgi:hypothetical protein
MKLQHLRKARTLYPGGGIWYARSYPQASGFSGVESQRQKRSVGHGIFAGSRDILASIRLHRRQVLVGTTAALSIAFVTAGYLLL